MDIIRFFVHYGMHFIVPAGIAYCFFRPKWKLVYLCLLLTMLVDLDHLLAVPIFDSNRCSIDFHPLHSYYAILIYFFGLFFSKTRIFAVGLLWHMLTDYQDCFSFWLR